MDINDTIYEFFNGLTAGTAALQQAGMEQMKDQYDRLRGIEPTSSKFGKITRIGLSGMLGFIPGLGLPINAIQALRLALMNRDIEDLKNRIGVQNLQNGTQPISPNQSGDA